MFEFKNYEFNQTTGVASFYYVGPTGIQFTEKVKFASPRHPLSSDKSALLERALFLAFIVLGTSYYKAAPTQKVKLHIPIEQAQADFFNQVFQEGLGQFAFENNLSRNNLATFEATTASFNPEQLDNIITSSSALTDSSANHTGEPLVLLSGGKDSLLTAEMLFQDGISFKSVYLSNNDSDFPDIVSSYGKPFVIRRYIDKEALKRARGMNGHVPITLINETLAIIQAILSDSHEIYIGLGREGEEPHAFIDDLAINHQWSKTPATQKALSTYIKNYISSDIKIRSLLEGKNELEIAGIFVEKCWDKFGNSFSSCNLANYKQGSHNQSLKWCGKCPKCANSFLLFAPYLPLEKQPFGRDLFLDPELIDTFKGLLGIDGIMKPFECIGEISELRKAYSLREKSYGDLPFEVPKE